MSVIVLLNDMICHPHNIISFLIGAKIDVQLIPKSRAKRREEEEEAEKKRLEEAAAAE